MFGRSQPSLSGKRSPACLDTCLLQREPPENRTRRTQDVSSWCLTLRCDHWRWGTGWLTGQREPGRRRSKNHPGCEPGIAPPPTMVASFTQERTAQRRGLQCSSPEFQVPMAPNFSWLGDRGRLEDLNPRAIGAKTSRQDFHPQCHSMKSVAE